MLMEDGKKQIGGKVAVGFMSELQSCRQLSCGETFGIGIVEMSGLREAGLFFAVSDIRGSHRKDKAVLPQDRSGGMGKEKAKRGNEPCGFRCSIKDLLAKGRILVR